MSSAQCPTRLWNDKSKLSFFLVLITETLRIIKRQFCFVILSREKYIYSFIYMFSQHRVPKEVHPKTFPSSLSFLFVRLMLSLLRLEWKKSKQKCDRNVVSEKNPQRLWVMMCLYHFIFLLLSSYCIYELFDRYVKYSAACLQSLQNTFEKIQ